MVSTMHVFLCDVMYLLSISFTVMLTIYYYTAHM